MLLLLGFAFLAGLVTILAPCIWPLLPIILSTSALGKSHKRPLGITLGIMISFGVVTLSLSFVIKFFHLDPNLLRLLAVVVIAFLGFTLLIPPLTALLESVVSRLTRFFGISQYRGNDFISGLITGLSLGIVWSPCAGPILATIATLASLGQVNLSIILVTISYVLGIGIPLFIFAYTGQQLFTKVKFLSSRTATIQQIFGVVMLLTALAIYTNYDTYIEAQLLNAFPQLSTSLNSFEGNSSVKQQLDVLKGKNAQTPNSLENSMLFNTNTPAPDFIGITNWLNSKPLTINNLKGKVVLVDFWTYTCINCIRTLPHVTAWYDKYKDDGFVVVGVHTPEFPFERDTKNVDQAIQRYNIGYPVAQDNNYTTWNNFNNEYWPAEYLIDSQGNVRRTHFGEGEYDEMEKAIQALLKDSGKKVTSSLTNMPDITPQGQLSPETYLGSSRMQYYFPSGSIGNGSNNFSLTNPQTNSFSLGGQWTIADENATTGKDATLLYNFYAQQVFLVINPPSGKTVQVKVFLDGKLVDSTSAGSDVQNGIVTVDSDRLYNLINVGKGNGAHLLKLEFLTPGTQVFAFTFG